MIADRKAIVEYESMYGLLPLLDHLEERMGGHGNGFALVSGGKVSKIKKGMKLSNKRIAKEILNSKFDWCIYHTRIKTFGPKSDANCHPFVIGDSRVAAMNGSSYIFGDMSEVVNMTDTELILRTVSGFNADDSIDMLNQLSPVFVGVFDGKPFALKNDGSLERYLSIDGVMYASEFPKKVPSEYLRSGFCFIDGVSYPGKIEYNYKWSNWKDDDQYGLFDAKDYIHHYDYGYFDRKAKREEIKVLEPSSSTIDKYGKEYELGYDDGWEDGYEAAYEDAAGRYEDIYIESTKRRGGKKNVD